jgi:hypothetical protein
MLSHEKTLGLIKGRRLGLIRSGKVQNQPEALWLDPVSLATEPRPNMGAQIDQFQFRGFFS